MSKMRITLVFLCCLSIFACKNDLDINAPWEEIPIVYGLLDANTNVQYIRIQKAYQNDVNTSTDQAAKIADSLVFDTLRVTIRGTDGSFYTLLKTIDIPKNSGVFATEKNYLYRANFRPNLNARYDLEIFSPKTGKTYRGSTSIIKTTDTSNMSLSQLVRPDRPDNRVSFNFISTNAYVYDALVRFYYFEYPVGMKSDSVIKYVDFVIERDIVRAPNNRYSKSNITTRDWINFLKSSIQPNNSVQREYLRIEHIVVGATLDLYNYSKISVPSASFVQKRTDYTNVPNALGIFSSRSLTAKNIPLRDLTDGNSSQVNLVKELPNFIY